MKKKDSKENAPVVPTKVQEPKIAKIVNEIKGLDETNLNLLREILGIRVQITGSRVSGNVQRTDKSLEGAKVAPQVMILIKSLPVDKAVTTAEWATLAVAGGLQTQQPPERIVAYYKKTIIALGFAKTI